MGRSLEGEGQRGWNPLLWNVEALAGWFRREAGGARCVARDPFKHLKGSEESLAVLARVRCTGEWERIRCNAPRDRRRLQAQVEDSD